ncbi:MAG: hypothetical protein V3W44_08550 [Dehalococcoidales bacterium]
MSSEVEICNIALNALGEARITALTEDNPRARLCNDNYSGTRDAEIVKREWNFAIARVSLAKLVTAPIFEFDNAYQLPDECLRVLETDDSLDIWRIEGRLLLTNADSVKIRFLQQVTDPNEFPADFIRALGLALALAIGTSITKSEKLMIRLEAAYVRAISDASGVNLSEDGESRDDERFSWLRARGQA